MAAKRRKKAAGKRRRRSSQSFCDRADDYCPPYYRAVSAYGVTPVGAGIVDGSGAVFLGLLGLALLWGQSKETGEAPVLKPPAKAPTPAAPATPAPPAMGEQQRLPGVRGSR